MSGGRTEATPDDLRRRLGEAATLVAAGGEALDGGRLPQLEALAPLIDGLTREVARLPDGHGRALRPALLALLDEVARLTGRLAAERARLGERLRDAGAHRRAGAAYRRTGNGGSAGSSGSSGGSSSGSSGDGDGGDSGDSGSRP